jgi:hydroxymethylbilane synthase
VIKFDPKEFIPAPAQGVLAFQVRESDKELRRQLRALHKQEVADCTNVERRVLKLLDGGCHLPLGAYCTKDHEGNYHLWAAYAETATAPLKQIRLSSSTRFELAEEAIKSLKG